MNNLKWKGFIKQIVTDGQVLKVLKGGKKVDK